MDPRSAKIIAVIFLGPLLLGPLLVKILPFIFKNSLYLSLAGLMIGSILILIPKFSVLQKGEKFTFGSSQMTERMRTIYHVGYGVFLTSVVLSLALAWPQSIESNACSPNEIRSNK